MVVNRHAWILGKQHLLWAAQAVVEVGDLLELVEALEVVGAVVLLVVDGDLLELVLHASAKVVAGEAAGKDENHRKDSWAANKLDAVATSVVHDGQVVVAQSLVVVPQESLLVAYVVVVSNAQVAE